MGWRQFVGQVQAANRRYARETRASARRSEREAMRQHRELVRQHREYAKENARAEKEYAKQQAADEAREYENYVAVLVSVHTDCGATWDWEQAARCAPPPVPERRNECEAIARRDLAAFQPGFFDRVLGEAKKRRAVLEHDLQRAIERDQASYDAAVAEHKRLHEHWAYQRHLAARIAARDLEGCRATMSYVGAFDELEGFKTRVTLEQIEQDVAVLSCCILDTEVIPTEEVKLTAGGKLTTKEMATSKYWLLYQDHVASAAIRVAREVFAALPVARAIVNVQITELNTATGHHDPHTVLAVHFTRGGLGKLNLSTIDPSDSMKNFQTRMKFKKGAGFDPIEPMSADEQWIEA